MINKIYLHWTAGRYDQFFNDYHICIDGDGVVHKMADFETKLTHTWHRNSNAVGIALCCCYQARITAMAPTMGELAAEQRPEGVSYGAKITLQPTPPQPSSSKRHPSQSEGQTNASPLGEGDHRRWWSGFTINWGPYPPTDMQIVSMARCVADICKQYNLPVNKDTVITHAEVADMDSYGVNGSDPDMRWDLLRLPFAGEMSGGEYIRNLAGKMASELDIAYGDVR